VCHYSWETRVQLCRLREDLTDRLDEANRQQAHVQQAHARLQGELQALQQRASALSSTHHAEMDSLQAERDGLKEMLQKANEALGTLQHEHADSISAAQAAEGLQVELAAEQSATKALEKGKVLAEEALQALQQEHGAIRQALAEAEQRCGMLGDAHAQANALRMQLEAQKQDMRDQGRELERLRWRLADTEAAVVAARERCRLCERDVEAGTQQRHALESAAIEMRRKMEHGRIIRQQLERELKKYLVRGPARSSCVQLALHYTNYATAD
jgi:chromosome segregation ATPase